MRSLLIIVTFFLLWVSSFLTPWGENFCGLILILTIGVLHGSNDIKLLVNLDATKSNLNSKWRYLLFYILIVFLGAVCFYLLPTSALLLFIGISAYHFGEQHWSGQFISRARKTKIYAFFYGLTIFLLLFYFNPLEVQEVVVNLTAFEVPLSWFLPLLLTSLGILFILTYVYRNLLTCNFVLEGFYLLIFSIIFSSTPLIWGFAIYFVIWHSIPSLNDQLIFLYGDVSRSSIFRYIKSSAIYWFFSILGLLGVYFFVGTDVAMLLPILFSFLAAITFPHVFVIDQIQKM
ncbi:MAG: Brp/Blh family beta-carotene 15,15'-dioxygenase [Leeuwenhoekiella sp.]|nr:Brp/Blh family beta-carotene 15,15'-dioxygenase [Leeuwenhoekiella sp.]